MRNPWRRGTAGDRHVAPVEMRFVDMFMAALGSLLFMAMLFAFLLSLGTGKAPIPRATETPSAGPLKLVSKALPSARVGVYYEIAIAYRGGSGVISWELPAGEKELNDGLTFDLSEGVLHGTPGSAGFKRFVIKVRDQLNVSDVRPYELIILEQKVGARKVESILVVLLFLVCLIACYFSIHSLTRSIRTVRMLEGAHRDGLPAIQVKTSAHTTIQVKLPEGIDTYRIDRQIAWKKAIFFVATVMALAGWFIWRVWLSGG
jgi:hypothetical protein